MSDNTPESNQDSGSATSSETKSFSEKYSDVIGKVNETLGNVDWTQMGKYGKAAGIIAVVVIAQIMRITGSQRTIVPRLHKEVSRCT